MIGCIIQLTVRLQLVLLLEAFLDNGWLGIGIYASVAIFMCATAWIPLILRKWITHLLLRDKPMSGKQQVQIIEWIHFHPLKKLLTAAGTCTFVVSLLYIVMMFAVPVINSKAE